MFRDVFYALRAGWSEARKTYRRRRWLRSLQAAIDSNDNPF